MTRLRALLLASCLCAAAQAQEIVFVAPTNHTEPIASFGAGGLLQGGILKDIGDRLAERLQRKPRYLPVPSRRVSETLRKGEADLVCYVLPGWLEGEYRWSVPVLPNAEVVAARPEAPDIQRLDELQNQQVGTVIGYGYTHLLAEPGQPLPFIRQDALNTRSNLDKLAAGRMAYAISEELTLRDYVRRHPKSRLRVVMTVARYTAQCAQSLQSRLDFEGINQQLAAMVREGEIRRILARYGS
ncbi:substrate-binding periplasmic protein [Inhella proteolytica]|uniref:Transporter substrate-binding domain-containing protein n=1 Tax=Inhella proteolytica TaxID=2795029 RepID=A0A931J5K7_9BURK|nr:transporter substrate-binding domain-containing protein [Inhella proteolytica]MBH9576600.1 transporter substrate-binding domain-containing protein [Inhella proteolytica]